MVQPGDQRTRVHRARIELEPVPEEDYLLEKLHHHGGDIDHKGRVDVSGDMTRHDEERLVQLISNHAHYTGSTRAKDILDHWAFSYSLLTVGLVECVLLGWVFGADKLRAFVNQHSKITWELGNPAVQSGKADFSSIKLSFAGAAPLLLLALALGEPVLPGDWTPVILLSLSSQLLGQGLLVYAMGHLSPVVVGLCFLTQPALSAAIGWAAYDESFTLGDGAGALLICVALVLIRLPARRLATDRDGAH